MAKLLRSFGVAAYGLVIWLLGSAASFAGEHEEAGNFEHVVNTDGLSGINLFLATLYNEHRLAYAVVVTLVMAALGILVAFVTDYLLRIIGLRKIAGGH
jgi:hypothetical protein